MNTKYLYIAIILLAIALFFVSYKSCTKKAVMEEENNIKIEQRIKDSINNAVDSMLDAGDIKKDSLTQVAVKWEYKYDSVIASQKNIRGLIKSRELMVQELLHELDSVKKDTIASIIDCRQLQADVYSLLNLTNELEKTIDTANDSHNKIIAAKDSIINNLTNQLAELKTAFTALTIEFNSAITSEKKFVRRTKLADLFTKISTVSAAILATILLLKK